MNLGVIVLDTLRYDVFCSEMPKTLERANHVFENMYSTSRWTVPAHASLFTGLYPTEAGTHSENLHLTTPVPTLAERLSNEGFATHLFSNNIYIDSFFGFGRGFDSIYRGPNLAGRPTESSGFDWTKLFNELDDDYARYPKAAYRILRSDSPTIPTLFEGAKMVASGDSEEETERIDWFYDEVESANLHGSDDVFVCANLMTCHSPYVPPEEYRTVTPYLTDPFELTLRDSQTTENEHNRHWESYKSCARYLDDSLQRLFDLIDWDALFVIGDHGELFGEHGLRQHQYGVYEDLVHVPAVAVGNEVPSGTSEGLTSLLDVYETIVEYADIETTDDSRGKPLFSEPSREHVYAESVGNYRVSPDAAGFDEKIPKSWGEPHYMYRTDDRVYVKDKDGERVLDSDWDGEYPDEIGAVREAVNQLRVEMDDCAGRTVEKEVPSEVASRLEKLGYR
ncbi:sulfatase-like hydrolase/transferase [Halorussus ruber]|uniref:sulfatase-like hydrolase/transferase n=1 Tax=Halorussus ruber TaxID=1126238 RepID=UPI0010920B0A|nr:sulfatase-like hydrolase/transferase [Halorussus ruber]